MVFSILVLIFYCTAETHNFVRTIACYYYCTHHFNIIIIIIHVRVYLYVYSMNKLNADNMKIHIFSMLVVIFNCSIYNQFSLYIDASLSWVISIMTTIYSKYFHEEHLLRFISFSLLPLLLLLLLNIFPGILLCQDMFY